MKPQLVCIDWIDASINMDNEQLSREKAEAEDLIHGFAVGVLIKEDKEKITIARDWFDLHDEFRGISTYPKSGISKIKRFNIFGKHKEGL